MVHVCCNTDPVYTARIEPQCVRYAFAYDITYDPLSEALSNETTATATDVSRRRQASTTFLGIIFHLLNSKAAVVSQAAKTAATAQPDLLQPVELQQDMSAIQADSGAPSEVAVEEQEDDGGKRSCLQTV